MYHCNCTFCRSRLCSCRTLALLILSWTSSLHILCILSHRSPLQYSSVDYPYSKLPYSSHSYNNVVSYHDDAHYVVAVAGSTAQHSYPSYTDRSHGKVVSHLAGGPNLVGYNGLPQHVAHIVDLMKPLIIMLWYIRR